jgi:hypothetical protein
VSWVSSDVTARNKSGDDCRAISILRFVIEKRSWSAPYRCSATQILYWQQKKLYQHGCVGVWSLPEIALRKRNGSHDRTSGNPHRHLRA